MLRSVITKTGRKVKSKGNGNYCNHSRIGRYFVQSDKLKTLLNINALEYSMTVLLLLKQLASTNT
jgi:hypothetical protein